MNPNRIDPILPKILNDDLYLSEKQKYKIKKNTYKHIKPIAADAEPELYSSVGKRIR